MSEAPEAIVGSLGMLRGSPDPRGRPAPLFGPRLGCFGEGGPRRAAKSMGRVPPGDFVPRKGSLRERGKEAVLRDMTIGFRSLYMRFE
jgi:hypothetical protein